MCNAVEPQLSGFVGTRWNSLWDNWDMNINEEQKLIKLRKQHLIVKQSIYKSFGKKDMVYIFSVCYEYTYLFTIIIHENWPKMLKCWSKSACLKKKNLVSIESYKQHKLAFTFHCCFFFFFLMKGIWLRILVMTNKYL